jgi:hypothetical protein
MKKIPLFLIIVTTSVNAQTLLLEENFEYTAGDNLTSHGWIAHSGGGTNPITVNNGGLTFTGYASSGVGNAALVDNDGEDDNKLLSSTVSTGTIYYSFLIKVSSIADGYFIHLYKNVNYFAARVFIKAAPGGFNFGLSNSSTGAFGSTVYSTGTTYLCIVKYDVSATGACSLWVKTEDQGVPQTEILAGTPEVTSTGSGQTGITAIALRQYSSSQNIIVDGIRVSDSWSQAPLPVQLTSFTAGLYENKIKLNWSTATEVNNYGFDIERCVAQISNLCNNWEKIGFVQGHGNSNSPKDYSFVDAYPPAGKVLYKLKQIDFDGAFEYSKAVEVNVETPQEFRLAQNYPNPFNPSTVISYQLPMDGNVTLKVYDMLGKEVTTLVNEFQRAASYNYQFSINNLQLSSGVYYYRLQSGNFVETKKFIVMK